MLNFVRYLLLPARPTVLMFIAALSLGFLLAEQAGLPGILLALVLLAWLFNYAYVLLEQIANGAREPPVLAIEMLNPANEQRPLLQLLIVLVVYGALRLLAHYLSPVLAVALEVLAFIALPASIGALGLGDSFWQAINPVVLWQIVQTLRLAYLGIVAVVLVDGLGLSLLAGRSVLPSWLLIPAAQFAWLSVFSLIGGNLAAAWQTIERELAVHDYAFEFYDWLLERLGKLDNPRLASRLAQDYITRALARDNARVTRLVQCCLAADPSFRPRSGAETLRVAELACLAGDRSTAQTLLIGFAEHFPGDIALAQAAAMAERLRRG